MTRLIDGLEARGLVRRRRASDDGRRVLVELTDGGRTEATRLNRLTKRSVAALLERIPASDRDQVVHSVGLLRRAAEEARAEIDCC